MAFLCLYLNSIPLSPFPSNSHLLPTHFHSNRNLNGRQFVAFSTHSNPRILKSNKRLPYGKLFFPYSDEEEEEEEVGIDELKGSKSEFSEGEHAEMKEFDMYLSGDQKKSSFQSKNDITQQGNWRVPKGGREETLKPGRNLQLKYNSLQAKRSKDSPERRKKGNVTHSAARVEERGFVNGSGKIKNGNSAESRFRQLSEDLGFDEKWFPLIDYLSTFGLKESHFIQISERHMPCLQLNVASAQERLEYLLSVGVKHRDIKKILLRQPQILCNRADYLKRTIESILKYQSAVASKFPLFVSQDGPDQTVKSMALSYNQLTYMQHLDSEPVLTEKPGELIAYYKIARHYKWALDQLFYKHNFTRVIILEDDMEIAPDFFDYFEAAATLLETDKTIMAVSSWNDNGQKQFVHDPNVLYRSDFFPGLGWMLLKSTWDELSPKWPKAYWDDWVRLKEVHKDRQFIRPEVCRTYNFGEHGSSMGQFFKQYLEPIKLNDAHVDWKSMDLSYMTEDNFVKHFGNLIANAKPVHGTDAVLKAYNIDGDVRIQYNDEPDFQRIARQFGIFEEWKDGIPRTAYKGVVVFRFQTPRRIFLIAPDSLRQLGIQQI